MFLCGIALTYCISVLCMALSMMNCHQNNTYYYNYYYILFVIFFFFNDTATTEIYTLSLHDALPISHFRLICVVATLSVGWFMSSHSHMIIIFKSAVFKIGRAHVWTPVTSAHLVCRLLLEKKKKKKQSTKLTSINKE